MTGPGLVFLLVIGLALAGGAAGVIRTDRKLEVSPGVMANERLSALTSGVLITLTAAVGVTILRIADLLPLHYLIGFLMLGPLALKLASTGYRFLRYYTDSATYRHAGPPQIVLRLTAPFLVLATVGVFVTGIELWLFGYRFGASWFQAHVVSFLVWTAALAVHLLGHTRRSVETAWEEAASAPRAAVSRRGLVVGSLVLGAALAAASLLYVSPFSLPGGPG